MNIEKYKNLSEKIKNKDFEGKYKNLDRFLYYFSWLGNIGAIFFAYFLVFPAFYDAINAHVGSANISLILSSVITVVILGVLELVKREVISNFSFDWVKTKHKISKNIFGWLISSIALLSISFYLSLTGAKNFASNTEVVTNKMDSIVMVKKLEITDNFKLKKEPYIDENIVLRESNRNLISKRGNTDSKSEYNKFDRTIKDNDNKIKENDYKLNKLDSLENVETNKIEIEYIKSSSDIDDNVSQSILLFIIISSSIELIIIFGVYFRQYYDYTTFTLNEGKLEHIIVNKNRYKTLLKFIYKDGEVNVGTPIMGASKLKEIVGSKSTIPSHNKFVDTFISDITDMGIVRLEGKKRYISISYDEAISRVEKFDNTLRLIDDLK